MKHVNGNAPAMSMASCADGCPDCASERLLGLLAENLQNRGLDARLATYAVDGVKGRHHDTVTVINPAASEQGMFHVEKHGLVTWEYSGTLDDAGASKIADDITSALRPAGPRFRQERSS